MTQSRGEGPQDDQHRQPAGGPPSPVVLVVALPGEVRTARRHVRRVLGQGHPAVRDVELLVSELVTNSVQHSDSAGDGLVRVEVTNADGVVRVEVEDDGSPDSVPCMSADHYSADNGRGMLLVDALATTWGVLREKGRTTTWFTLKY
ncbi:ATP-binding protein [Bailinhaonella thermotolerans]|nr:ATP-binding protein [Bailinhaonella thermotolerans]